MKCRYIFPAGVLLLLLLPWMSPLASAAEIAAVRRSVNPEKTRFVLEFDAPFRQYKVHDDVARNQRFWIDVFGLTAGKLDNKEVKFDEGQIAKVTIRHFQASQASQIEVSLKAHNKFEILVLENPSRLVIDVSTQAMVLAPAKSTAQGQATSPRSDQLVNPVPPQRERVIIIDPGHGGASHGATRRYKELGTVREKDITLAVGLELERIMARDPSFKVYLTRRTDRHYSKDAKADLKSRVDIGAKYKGDLFISIHCNATNASFSRTARGFEVYYLNSRGEENHVSSLVAQRENNYDQPPARTAPAASVSAAHKAFFTGLNRDVMKRYVAESRNLAQTMANVFKQKGKFSGFAKYNRGVKDANFHVLRQSQPQAAVLIELGFINNYYDAQYLKSTAGQREAAQLIYESLVKYWAQSK